MFSHIPCRHRRTFLANMCQKHVFPNDDCIQKVRQILIFAAFEVDGLFSNNACFYEIY